jgi:hypothetical protein
MARERKNAPQTGSERRRTRGGGDLSPGERVRRRLSEQPELELTDEELRALADEGIDPDDVRRLARERNEADEVSDHDRDTARDEVEGLVIEQGEDY